METPKQGKPFSDPRLPEFLVRTIRHDIGDFLQTVYSAVALLQHRLPPECTLERTIVGNLRVRAGGCKELLDTLHDFVCPPTLTWEPVDLAALTQELVKSATVRFPHLQIRAEADQPVSIDGDRVRLGHVGNLILMSACQAARRQVVFHAALASTDDEAEWAVSDDGPGLTTEQLEQIFRPFSVSRRGTLEIGLAPARDIVLLHGGRITVSNLPGNGVQIHVRLPRQSTAEKSP